MGEDGRKLRIMKGSQFLINFEAIHHDPVQWPQPEKFVPERFDFNQANNKWTLTTEGKPRNPLSFTPFMGGKRICLGKTFVDTSIRFTVPMLVYFLNFDFTNPKEQSTKKDYYSIGGQRELDMPMRITIRNKA